MSLVRLNDSIVAEFPEGIAFGMIEGQKAVRCVVSREALENSGAKSRADQMRVFRAIRDDVESAASRKFDRGELRPDGSVFVSGADLHPEKYTT